MFSRTEPKPEPGETQAAPKDKVKAIGIGLKESEWARLEKIAGELGTTRHTLTLWALRDFIRRYDEGFRPATEKKTTLKMP